MISIISVFKMEQLVLHKYHDLTTTVRCKKVTLFGGKSKQCNWKKNVFFFLSFSLFCQQYRIWIKWEKNWNILIICWNCSGAWYFALRSKNNFINTVNIVIKQWHKSILTHFFNKNPKTGMQSMFDCFFFFSFWHVHCLLASLVFSLLSIGFFLSLVWFFFFLSFIFSSFFFANSFCRSL